MTAIAAVTKNGETWIGSDGKTFRGHHYYDSGRKFLHLKGFSVAYCNRAAAWQIIEMEISEFKIPKKMDIKGVYKFGQWVKKTLQDHGVKKEAAVTNDLPSHPLELVVATASGKLFTVCGDGSVSEHKKFVASGAGIEFLIGSLDVLYKNKKMSADDILKESLSVAIRHSCYCEKPMFVERVKA